MLPELRTLSAGDLEMLRPALKRCLLDLAAYHNRVAQIYAGMYPLHDYDDTLDAMIDQLKENKTHIAALLEYSQTQQTGLLDCSSPANDDAHRKETRLTGFCQATISGKHGSLDYLYIDESRRGLGYGARLMDWAMQVFAQARVRSVDIKVVLGNDAQAFYEKYGFRTRAVVLAREFQKH